MKYCILIISVIMLLITSACGSFADVVSSFNTSSDGWNVTDLQTCPAPYDPPIGVYTASWVAAGGYISCHDPSSNSFFFNAPAKFLGNISAYYGGRLNFSLMTTKANWYDDSVVAIIGNNGKIIAAPIGNLPGTTWTSYSIPLSELSFRYNNKKGAKVSKSDLLAVMASVKALRIDAEYGAQVEETTSLDEVGLYMDHSRVYGISNRALHDSVALAGAGKNIYRIWGRATLLPLGMLILNDGSGAPVSVYAPGYSGFADGDYVSATGILTQQLEGIQLNCAAADVVKAN